MFGKTITQIIRLCGVLQCLETCFEILLKLKANNKLIINTEIELEIDAIIINLSLVTKITLPTLNNAKRLMAYYNNNRILMAGYNLNLITFENEINLDSFLNTSINISVKIPNSNDLKLIMEYDGTLVSATVYSQAKRTSSHIVIELFKTLERYKLGKVITSKNTKGPKTIYFQKINFELLNNDKDLITLIEILNIDLTDFKNSYNKNNISRKLSGKL